MLSDTEANALKTWAASKQIPIDTVQGAARSIRNWYDALPSKRARACWVAVIRKAAVEEDDKRRRSGHTGARGAPRPPGPNNPEMPQQRGYREGSDLLKKNVPHSGSDFMRELEPKLKAVGTRAKRATCSRKPLEDSNDEPQPA